MGAKSYDHGLRTGVLGGVHHRFLGDPVEMDAGFGIEGRRRSVAFDGAGDSEASVEGRGQLLEGGLQALGLEPDRIEPACEIAGLGDGIVDQVGDAAGAGCRGGGLLHQFFVQQVRGEGGADELLAEAVVEIQPDDGAFAVADRENVFFQLPFLGDLGFQRCRAFADALFEVGVERLHRGYQADGDQEGAEPHHGVPVRSHRVALVEATGEVGHQPGRGGTDRRQAAG